ncbi:hypothetical protein CQW23_06905 [Capsicum baccatum]|uniref:Non-haem dioxygenase N-terminal domain-containing protein n=1 Tax=Capsicum baccatum TaxID=33114 RepID=A0A2G2X4Q4_CAPBA|nr:hypothetical protein CQW23_06905 [Capsicum baccatum]
MDIDCMNSNGKSSMLDEGKQLIFDASNMKHYSNIPKQYIWPDYEKPCVVAQELPFPVIDLRGFFYEGWPWLSGKLAYRGVPGSGVRNAPPAKLGDPVVAQKVSRIVDEAYSSHSFFLVNHGVDANLISNAHCYLDAFFDLQLSEKQKAQRKIGEYFGYASRFTERFSSKFPWIEILSFRYSTKESSSHIVEEYFQRTLGECFNHLGCYQMEDTRVAYTELWDEDFTAARSQQRKGRKKGKQLTVHQIVHHSSAKTGIFCLDMMVEVIIRQENDGPPDRPSLGDQKWDIQLRLDGPLDGPSNFWQPTILAVVRWPEKGLTALA